ncbi:hypothetical protein V8E51_019134 [Hyaloscypha variabilis]
MAEAFGVVASGLGVASLAIQTVENLNKVITFCKSIKEALTDIQRLLLELQILSNVVSAIQLMYEKHSLSESSEAVTRKCLDLVRLDISKLLSLSLELERKLNSGKRITRTWARVQTVLSESKIATLRGHLEQAKIGLQLLQGCHIFEDIRALKAMSSQTPKSLGYYWETGEVEDHVKIDDGLEKPFYLPLDLCSTPQGFIDILSHKYKSKKLPGLTQIERGHFRVFDWNENRVISPNNWTTVMKGRSGIKLAFIMMTWHGLPRDKCIRCYKPQERGISRRYSKCTSCGLELHRVEPDAIPFETEDISIGFSPNQYRDYILASRPKSSSASPAPNSKPTSSPPSPSKPKPKPRKLPALYADPPIDAVCKRLIVKWEPIWNFVHRYLHCRCILRLSTPSQLIAERTVLVFASCPRHNSTGLSHRDYGDIDYNTDRYFARFGGYKAFQGIIYLLAGNVFETLGGERFLPKEQKDEAVEAFDGCWMGDIEGFWKVLREYMFEVNDELERVGFELPEQVLREVKEERVRRRNEKELREGMYFLGLRDDTLVGPDGERRELSKVPMVREVNEILEGRWDGKPHWALDD